MHVHMRVLREARNLQLILLGIFGVGYSEFITLNIHIWKLLLKVFWSLM